MCRAYRLSESVELQKLSDTLSEIARAFLPLASSLSFRTADEYSRAACWRAGFQTSSGGRWCAVSIQWRELFDCNVIRILMTHIRSHTTLGLETLAPGSYVFR